MLERLLSDFNEENLDTRVLIGSRLLLHDLEDQTADSLTLVFPAHTEPSAGRISWFSPLGLQLLMAEAGQEYSLEIPSGTIRVRLDDIRFENYGEIGISR
ncbi:nucleoside diphosphate kinase regulator [compost metagenome]